MPSRTEAIKKFLEAKTHADLAALYGHDMECQVNVAQDGGQRTEGEYKGKPYRAYTDGVQTWKAFRIPYNAATIPEYDDVMMKWSLDQHAEAIGMTGWDWMKRLSRWVAYDFDAITGHSEKHKKKLSEEELEKVRKALMGIPWVTIRRSTGGAGLHVYVFLQPVLTQNHNEHAALARAILGQLAALTGCEFESQVDVCGGNMWVWHRKMAGTPGLEVLKRGEVLVDIPPLWKDHIRVVTGHRRKNLPKFLSEADSGSSDAERWFTELTSQYPRMPLDDEHKRLVTWLADHQTQSWWDPDHHMLVTHSHHLKQAHEDLKLRGLYETIAEGTEAGHDHNCYAFPMRNGGWSVRRYSMGVAEKPSWDQDARGWTRCFYNMDPDLNSAARSKGGTEDPAGGYVFNEAELAAEAARLLGATVPEIPIGLRAQRAKLKPHKDGRLVIEIEGDKNGVAANQMQGWLHDKGKWKRLFPIQVGQPVEPEGQNQDDSIRHLVAQSGQDAGWVIKRGDSWDEEPLVHITKILEGMGMGQKEIKSTVGGAAFRAWRLVNRPFQPEYPGDRIWNRNSAQFRVVPSQNDVLHYPTWMKILVHVGSGLDEAIQNNSWAKANGILSGADYLKIWIASLFKEPTEPLPYLFFYGNQNTGKSIVHEALALLMTKGYKLAHLALTSQGNFNEELGNAILCVVEELNLRKDKNAANRIKEWVTARTIAIHGKGYAPYQDVNTTHWMQFGNDANYCPIFPGDTRITMIYVPDLAPEDRIPKKQMLQMLEREAPDFLSEVLKTDIPPSNDRLNVPVVVTAEKADAERMNQTPIETFLSEICHHVSGKVIKYGDLYDKFQEWADPGDAAYYTKQKFGRELPPQYPKGRLPTDGAFYVGNLSFEAFKLGDEALPKLKTFVDEKRQVFLIPEGSRNGNHIKGTT